MSEHATEALTLEEQPQQQEVDPKLAAFVIESTDITNQTTQEISQAEQDIL